MAVARNLRHLPRILSLGNSLGNSLGWEAMDTRVGWLLIPHFPKSDIKLMKSAMLGLRHP